MQYREEEIKSIIEENNHLKEVNELTNSFLIVSKTDADGIITYVNDLFIEVSGFSERELLGSSHNIVRHPDVPKSFFKIIWQRISVEKQIWRGVVRNRRKDGSSYYLESIIKPIFDKNGEIKEYISLRKDISKRIDKEKDLKREKQFIQDVLNYQDSIIILTNEEQGMLDVNAKFFEYVDFRTIEEFKEHFKCVGDLFIPEQEMMYSCAIDWIEDIYERQDESIHRAKFIGKGGKVYFFSVRVDKIKASSSRMKRYNIDNENIYLMTLHDITELEFALRKAKAGQESKSRFLANMSHEIRTPMNGILGFTELLKKTQLSETQEKYLDTIMASSKTLLGIINDILDFSKVENGNMSLEYMKFSPIHEFEPTLDLFTAMALEKNHKYFVFIEPSFPRWIVLDPLRLKQIVSNLVGNAIKFTPEGGKVFVDITHDRVNSQYLDMSVSVTDTGIGIPEEKQKAIFTPFSQADDSITRKFGGTGLGLSITKSFVELMGGELGVESEVGRGSRFFFSLRVEASQERALDFGWMEKFEALLYISDIKSKSDEALLIEKYLYAFKLKFSTTTNIEDSKLAKIVWVVSSSVEERDFYNLLESCDDKPVILVDCGEDWVSSVSKERVTRNIKFPLNMSTIYDSLQELLSKDVDLEEQVHIKEKGVIKFDNISVLVVEDNEVNQMFVELLLQEYGIEPDMAENGRVGVEMVDKKYYDLILMDINMPVLGGMEATTEIREMPHRKDSYIVALTANAMAGDREKFIEHGMDDYLTKPLEVAELERVLLKFLQSDLEKDSKIATSEENIGELLNMIKVPENSFGTVSKDIIAKELGLPPMFVDKIVGKFFQTIDKDLDNLESAIRSSDIQEIQNVAHKIKGSSANLRFKYLSEIMKTIEYSAKDGVDSGYEDLFGAGKDELGNVKQVLG
jgi:PAS domain S-box-containing protein